MQIVSITPNDILTEKIFEQKRTPTFLTVIFVGLAWFANELALAWVHDRVPRDHVEPLPDLWFSIFPEMTTAIRITELIMIVLLINLFFVMVGHQYRWIVIRRIFFCVSLCYSFRAFCIIIFQVPVPSKKTYCAPKSNGSLDMILTRVLKTFWSAGIEQLRPRELCGDLIVSGHTITLFTSALALKQYCPRRIYYLAELYYFSAFLATFCILLSRKHYTIDVVLAYWLTTRTFWSYHSLSHSYHQGDFEQNPLSNLFWASLVPYLEADAPPPHHFLNRLKWPSSCAQRLRKRCP